MADDAKPAVYVYIHRRPDGEAFYIGKGMGRRAWDFSPRRRTAHHRNIMEKYGRANIIIELIPAASEAEAHALEVEQIAAARARGDRLCNLTDGGEGVSGRKVSEAQKAALAKGRGRHTEDRNLSPEALAQIAEARARGIAKCRAWRQTDEGRAQVAELGKQARAWLHVERVNVCIQCHQEYVTRSAMGKCCSRLCEQRHRRARDKAAAK